MRAHRLPGRIRLPLTLLAAICLLGPTSFCGDKNPEQAQIVAQGGLRMRVSPDLQAQRILTIPDGTIVEILERQSETIEVAGRQGEWTRVRFENQDGWVFGGFLNPLEDYPGSEPLPGESSETVGAACAGLEDLWGRPVSEETTNPGGPEGTELEHSRTVIVYSNGARIVTDQYDEGGTSQYDFPPGTDLRTAFETARDCGVFARFSINREYDWPPVTGSGIDEVSERIEWSVSVEKSGGEIQKVRIEEASGPYATIEIYEEAGTVIVKADVGV